MQSEIFTRIEYKSVTHHILLYRLGRLAYSASKTFCASRSHCDKYAHRLRKQGALRVHKRVDKCTWLCHNDLYHILDWVRTEDSHTGLHLVYINRKHGTVGSKLMYYTYRQNSKISCNHKKKEKNNIFLTFNSYLDILQLHISDW